ncbi:MAG: hypothetical protein WCA46_03450, partial [Actinocatenispora sp.]
AVALGLGLPAASPTHHGTHERNGAQAGASRSPDGDQLVVETDGGSGDDRGHGHGSSSPSAKPSASAKKARGGTAHHPQPTHSTEPGGNSSPSAEPPSEPPPSTSPTSEPSPTDDATDAGVGTD